MAIGLLVWAAGLTPQEPVDFSREIRPLLSDRCFICHGPDEEAREADLRLDLRAGATADLGGEAAVVPGKPEESLLMRRVRHERPRRLMPPPRSKLSLSEEEIALLERWIAEGADYEEHWAFVRPERPTVPEVEDAGWARDDLDRFVLARLEAAGRAPAPEAGRATWLRRVHFDLSGLPPTPEELDAFLADDAPDAYGRVVDGLLASTRYGERLASDWLDAARYAETYGYQSDVGMRVWPWRDWVIGAFNEDLRWDDFVTWQLAGDLLEEPTHDQRLATAFNRLHRQTNEGGSTEEEYRVEYVADRVHTFGTAFLGLTMECARCHDHKYDPISQEEYYRLFAFFDDIDESGLYSHFTNAVPTPTLWLPDAQQEQSLGELGARVAEREAALAAAREEALAGLAAWLAEQPERLEVAGRTAAFDFDAALEGALPNAIAEGPAGKMGGGVELVEGRGGKALRLDGDGGVSFPGVGAFTRNDPFTIALRMRPTRATERAVVFHRSRAWTDAGSRGYQLLLEDGELSASLIHFWPGNALRVRALEPLPLDRWSHVAFVYDGSSRAAGLELWVDGVRIETEVVRDALTRTILGGGDLNLTIGERFRDRGFAGGEVDDLEVFDRRLTAGELAVLAARSEESLAEAPNVAPAELEPAAQRELFLATGAPGVTTQLQELKAARVAQAAVVGRVPEIMTMAALAEPRRAFFLERGSYLEPSHEVWPGTPESVLPFPEGAPPDRLGLARWLTAPENPLFGRVTVNRFWQLVFGTGLVSSSENFGSQGAEPVQRELLDYLTHELRDDGWSVKRLLRRLVLSATYRQSSRASAEFLERDPDNLLLARGPVRPLSAEQLRDNALYLGELLVEKVGGPSVRPYQPPGLWHEKSGARYQEDKGEGLWRRSLYTYWKRTSPPPSMVIFDATKRDVCVVRRQRTTSPLQALALWNDPQQVEAARGLAQRVLRADLDDVARLGSLFRWCTSRAPEAAELEALGDLLASAREAFAADAEATTAYLAVGTREPEASLDPPELAAWAVVAGALFASDSTVTLR